ncbi:MAG: hypothetical protein M3Y06_12645 [Actinomycetota bacterium]|nr:hypothetical protein [Actinomycetota bacterium]
MTFDEFLSGRLVDLVRFAVVLCGQRATAEQLVADAVLHVYDRQIPIADPETAYAELRVWIVRGYLSEGMRLGAGLATDVDRPIVEASQANDDWDDLTARFVTSSKLQRTLAALRYYAGLDVAATASVMGSTPDGISLYLQRVLRDLNVRPDDDTAGHASGANSESAIRELLAMYGDDVAPDVEQVAGRLRDRLPDGEVAERARLDAERLESDRVEADRLEAGRVEQDRVEAERLAAERAEDARAEAQRIERERAEDARAETQRIERERASLEPDVDSSDADLSVAVSTDAPDDGSPSCTHRDLEFVSLTSLLNPEAAPDTSDAVEPANDDEATDDEATDDEAVAARNEAVAERDDPDESRNHLRTRVLILLAVLVAVGLIVVVAIAHGGADKKAGAGSRSIDTRTRTVAVGRTLVISVICQGQGQIAVGSVVPASFTGAAVRNAAWRIGVIGT